MNLDEIFRAGAAKHQAGDLGGAEAAYQQILGHDPRHFDAQHLLGVVRLQQGRGLEAIALIERAIALNDKVAGAFANLGAAHLQLGQPADALRAYDRALALDAANTNALDGHGEALLGLGRPDEALASFERSLTLASQGAALKGRAMALSTLGRHEDALKAWRLTPAAPDVLANIGFSLIALERHDEAVAALKQALAASPASVPALRSLLIALVRLKTLADEIALFEHAEAAAPQDPEVHLVHGLALRGLGRQADALAAFERALALDPKHLCGLSETVYARRFACDWRGDADLDRLRQQIEGGKPIEPYMGVLLFDDHALQQRNTRAYMARSVEAPVCMVPAYRHAKPRIAYISADFRDHPVAAQVVDLIARHDRNSLDITGLSYGPADDGALRARLDRAFAPLHDVRDMTDRDIAAWLAAHEIDIAVDLTGHTGMGRMGIFANRGAPIQVNYLAYPGMAGVPYFDYIVADDFVIPTADRAYYDEKIVSLPDSYWVTDTTRAHPTKAMSRAAAGLPAQGFVFSCFNGANKITPEVFAVWMRLLRQVEGSILWLRGDRADTQANLRLAAQTHRIDPARIIFASRVSEEEHFARQLCADLFLDTTGYNAHATASDALWAGTPLVTCAGNSYAARAAGSVLRAGDMSDLVTTSLADYEALALALARDPARLADARARVKASWTQSALFDTDRFARHLETAYRTMIAIAQAGERPRAFAVGR